MGKRKATQGGKRDSDSSEEANHMILYEEGNFEVVQGLQFKEGAYFEAAINMEEWF